MDRLGIQVLNHPTILSAFGGIADMARLGRGLPQSPIEPKPELGLSLDILYPGRRASAAPAKPTDSAYPPSSAPHEAFALAFRPGERLFHRLALCVAQHHLGERRLRIDLLRDLRRGRRGRN